MKYSITLASFRNLEPVGRTVARLAKTGLDALEMFGEPDAVDMVKLNDLLSTHRIPVCGITGMWGSINKDGWKRRLLSSDQKLVKISKKYVKDCVRMCNLLGGREMNICLFSDDKPLFDPTHSVVSRQHKEKMARRAAPMLSELCRFAADHGVQLTLEPLNRYSTPYCSTVRDALEIVRLVNSDSMGLLLDTFHMNIEEDSFEDAIQRTGRVLKHMHFADNNRKMPGFGHIDFRTIMRSLRKASYNGYVSFEPNISRKNYEYDLKQSLEFVKSMNTSF